MQDTPPTNQGRGPKQPDLLNEFRQRLARAGVFSPDNDVRKIVSYVLKEEAQKRGVALERVSLEQHLIPKCEPYVAQREQREPLERILGSTKFCGLEIRTAKNVFKPCSDTQFMVEHALLEVDGREKMPLRILDLGTGTGCLLLALLRALPHATGIGVDLDEATIDVARHNAEINGLIERSLFVVGNWGTLLEEKFDIVLASPPSIPTKNLSVLAPEMKNCDPVAALDGGKDGLSFFRYIAKDLKRILKPDGFGIFQAYSLHREERVLRHANFNVDVKPNYIGDPCCVLVRNKKRREPLSFLKSFYKQSLII